MNEKGKYKKVEIKLAKQKEIFIDQIKKTPIIQVVCEKLEIGRTSYYRWRKDDEEFAEECDKAIFEGKYLINDLAESQLISAIKDKNLTAIIFWLKAHHSAYSTKVELTTKNPDGKLTPEQEESIRNALTLAQLINPATEESQNEQPKEENK